jgi:hypothetical protein
MASHGAIQLPVYAIRGATPSLAMDGSALLREVLSSSVGIFGAGSRPADSLPTRHRRAHWAQGVFRLVEESFARTADSFLNVLGKRAATATHCNVPSCGPVRTDAQPRPSLLPAVLPIAIPPPNTRSCLLGARSRGLTLR